MEAEIIFSNALYNCIKNVKHIDNMYARPVCWKVQNKKNQGNPNGQYILFMGWKTQRCRDIHSLQSDL